MLDQLLSGCRQRSPGNRAKPRSAVTHSHPDSIARAAKKASGTRLPFAPACRHSRVKIDQCCAPGNTGRQIGWFSQRAGEVQRLRQLAGFPEDPWMGDDPHEAAEYQVGAGEAGVTVDCAVQPGPVILVVGSIFSERVHEHTVRDDVRAKLRSSIKRLLVSQGYLRTSSPPRSSSC